MDISKQFSLTDFLAYFFPGAFATVGMYFLAQLTPAKSIMTISSLDITTGLSFLMASYIIGVILSGFSSEIVQQVEKVTGYKHPHRSLPPDMFPDEITKAFRDVFGVQKGASFSWTINHYRLCRSLVIEKMPALAPRITRQDDMALLRRNLIFPELIWTVLGIGWGIWNINSGARDWGISLIVISLIISFMVIRNTIKRMHNSKGAETRETLLGFLAGYEAGVFSTPKKS
jgi:hypothetical protein